MPLPNLNALPPQSPVSKRLSPEVQKQIRDLLETERKLKAQLAIKDAAFWMCNCTKTKDEQDTAHPYKPFPLLPYLPYVIDVFNYEPIVWLEKSRTMMCSWIVSAWA